MDTSDPLVLILAELRGIKTTIDALSAENAENKAKIEALEEGQIQNRMAEGFHELRDPSTPGATDGQFARRATILTRLSNDDPSSFYGVVDPNKLSTPGS